MAPFFADRYLPTTLTMFNKELTLLLEYGNRENRDRATYVKEIFMPRKFDRKSGISIPRPTLAENLSAHLPGISPKEAEVVIETFISELIASLRMHGDVTIGSFGRLYTKRLEPRQRRNPFTGQLYISKAKDVVKCKVSTAIARRVFDEIIEDEVEIEDEDSDE